MKKYDNGKTALMLACEYMDGNAVEILIKHTSDLNVRDYDGRTALMLACIHGRTNTSKLLIEHGAQLDVRDRGGATPLIVACRGGHFDIVKLLIEKGVDVDASDEDGTTPLMAVCMNEHGEDQRKDNYVKIIRLLIKHGADVDKQDIKRGHSAVMFVITTNNVQCLQELMKAKPCLDLVDRKGKTVFSLAMEKGNTKCIKWLLEDGKLMTDGRLKPVHKDSNILYYKLTMDSLLVTVEFGVFEWKWCPLRHFKPVALAALKAGLSPGKIQYNFDEYLSPLVVSLLINDTELTETFLKHLYYYPEDLRTLREDTDIRGRIENTDLLEDITHQVLSLQTLCFLTVSKDISTSTVKRRQQVDDLEIPKHLKPKLKFEI